MSTNATGGDRRSPEISLGCASSIAVMAGAVAMTALSGLLDPSYAEAQTKRPNIVVLMTDDTGWQDFGAYSGGSVALGHPTPNVDRIAKEGATFTNWYGQASCTAGRASFITGRIPIRSALSIVVAPGDENYLRKETPTIAEFFQKSGYSTYFSGKWHLGDKADSYPIEHGFDQMKHFAAYYAGVYAYDDTSRGFHPWFPSYNPEFKKAYDSTVNLGEWEGVAGQPATMRPLRPSTSVRPTRRSTTSSSMRRTTSHSSWTSISSRCTTRPTRHRTSAEGRTLVTIRIPSWNSMPTSAGSWMPSGPRRLTPSLS